MTVIPLPAWCDPLLISYTGATHPNSGEAVQPFQANARPFFQPLTDPGKSWPIIRQQVRRAERIRLDAQNLRNLAPGRGIHGEDILNDKVHLRSGAKDGSEPLQQGHQVPEKLRSFPA